MITESRLTRPVQQRTIGLTSYLKQVAYLSAGLGAIPLVELLA